MEKKRDSLEGMDLKRVYKVSCLSILLKEKQMIISFFFRTHFLIIETEGDGCY